MNKCAHKLIFLNEKKQKYSDPFSNRKLTLKVKLRHFLTPPHQTNTQNSIISFGYVDFQAQIFPILYPPFENLTTRITIIYIHKCKFLMQNLQAYNNLNEISFRFWLHFALSPIIHHDRDSRFFPPDTRVTKVTDFIILVFGQGRQWTESDLQKLAFLDWLYFICKFQNQKNIQTFPGC